MDKQETQEMVAHHPVQELKSERVQQELVLEEPFRISLKSERVQEELAPAGAVGKVSTFYELSFNQTRAVMVELHELQAVITLFATGGQEAA
jgi:hypothetical protein